MPTLAVHVVRACSPARFVRLVQGLLDRVAADGAAGGAPARLLVAELTGDAVLLGRFQRARSALPHDIVAAAGVPVLRRLGGGRALRAGDGHAGVALALPHPGALLAAPVGNDKVLNRAVRGLRAGLIAAGLDRGVFYFGRDHLSCAGQQVGVVSMDALATGPALFEAFVGHLAPVALPAGWSGYPAHADPRAGGPPAASVASLAKAVPAFERLAEAIVWGYARRGGVEVVRDADLPAEGAAPQPPPDEDETGFEHSGVADIACGFAEGLVRHDGERVVEARLRGDFIAPAFVLTGLEASLAGARLSFDDLGRRVNAAFAEPGAALHGVRALRVFADAVLAAAGRL